MTNAIAIKALNQHVNGGNALEGQNQPVQSLWRSKGLILLYKCSG